MPILQQFSQKGFVINEGVAVDANHGFVLATELTQASVSDSVYLPYVVAASCHTEEPIDKVCADKGYYGEPKRSFLAMNNIADGIMRNHKWAPQKVILREDRVAIGQI